MKKSSTWTALQNPVFRKLWFASLISVMSAVASLPFFLFYATRSWASIFDPMMSEPRGIE
jgi:hypothetical protein